MEAEVQYAACRLRDLPGHTVDDIAEIVDEHERNAQPNQHTHRRRQQAVDHAFAHEHLHKVAALHTHGAGNAHFAAPLCREHDEDQEDEDDARQHGEEAEDREERREDGAAHVGRRQHRLLAEGIEHVKLVDTAEGISQRRARCGGHVQPQQTHADFGVGQRRTQRFAYAWLVQRRGQGVELARCLEDLRRE